MNISKYIDLTNLRKEANNKDIKKLVKEGIAFQVGGICIDPSWVCYVKSRLKGTNIKTVTVPNWRIGGGLKGTESEAILMNIADELDLIINIYEMYELKRWGIVEKDIKFAKEHTNVLKVIIETSYLRLNHPKELKKLLKQAVQVSEGAGADWIKTDSGLFKRLVYKQEVSKGKVVTLDPFDSLVEDVILIKKATKLKIKAAGGIRTRQQVERLIALGVDRIGTSKVTDILKENNNVTG